MQKDICVSETWPPQIVNNANFQGRMEFRKVICNCAPTSCWITQGSITPLEEKGSTETILESQVRYQTGRDNLPALGPLLIHMMLGASISIPDGLADNRTWYDISYLPAID